MANGYSTNMSGMGITQTAIIPQGVMNVIRVNENTPNLQIIQSFPVVSRNGNVHIHQDPVTGQMYEMTDEFHSMIPQIVAGNSSVMTGGVMPNFGGNMTDSMTSINNTSTNKFEDISQFPLEMSSSPNYIFAKILSLDFENKSYKNLNDYLSVNTQNTTALNGSQIIGSNVINYTTDVDINQNVNMGVRENFGTPIALRTPEVRFIYPSVAQSQNATSNNSNVTSRFRSDVKFVYPRP